MVARARWVRNCVTGRNELSDVEYLFRADPVFTPYGGEGLDIARLEAQIDRWLQAAQLDPSSIAAGGALVTGLAARSANADKLTRLVKARFHQAVVAATNDPCLESWLAFMGNALELSRAQPQRPFINIDIGGGTSNLAWGMAGGVQRCGCYYVGARLAQVEPGTYRLRSLSTFAAALLGELGIAAKVGGELTPDEIEAVIAFYVHLLEAAITGGPPPHPHEIARQHCQVEFMIPRTVSDLLRKEPVITLSGGVGELAYRHARGEPMPEKTAFGDLGIDLAKAICESPVLGRHLTSHVPSGLGRATVQGLTIHSTEVSGATIYLPKPEILPLVDLPILGTIGAQASESDLDNLLELAARAEAGACLRIELEDHSTRAVKALGERLAGALELLLFPATHALVLLTSGNIGKTLGHYATRWGRTSTALVVIDELPARFAQFATIGRFAHGLIPVSFHGLEGRVG